MGLSRVTSPCHFPATLLKSVTAVGCNWLVGAMELQATMRCKKAKPINPTIFFILHAPSVNRHTPLDTPIFPPFQQFISYVGTHSSMSSPTVIGFGREGDSVSRCSTMADWHRLIRPFESAGAPPHLPARNLFYSLAPKYGCNNPRPVSSGLPSCLHTGTIDLRLDRHPDFDLPQRQKLQK